MEATLAAFILSGDMEALLTLKQTLGHYGISPLTCRSATDAAGILKHKRFDLFVIDFAVPGAGDLLGLLRSHGAGNSYTVIALLPRGMSTMAEEALRKQVRHVLPKPFTAESATKTLKASYGLIAMEKRAYFRCAVRIGASATYEDSHVRRTLPNVSVRDVSQGGLCIKTDITLPKDATVYVDFELPGSQPVKVHSVGKVMWSDPNGQAGISFKTIPASESLQLRAWLNAQCPWSTELLPKTGLPAGGSHLTVTSALTAKTL